MSADRERRHQLGRGLSALFGDAAEAPPAERGRAPRNVPIEALRPSRLQPRRRFDETAIAALADSVREQGILQPILVRRVADAEGYEIVAGERRWRAAQRAQLHEVPVLVRDLSDRDALEAALVENVQRESLSPVEEAEGYRRLMDEFGYTQEQLARAVGKSRSHVANTLRLLGLPSGVRGLLDEGRLTAGHARALLTAPDPDGLAARVAARGLSVRETERLAQGPRPGRARRNAAPPSADMLALERELSDLVGQRVQIACDGAGGTVTIRFADLDQFDGILRILREGARRPPSAD